MEFARIADKKRLDFITKAITQNIPITGQILDVGCGNGIITRAIGAKGYNITGIDSSEKTIEAANAANTLSNVKFTVFSAEDLARDDRKYSAIICSEVLEHLEKPGQFVLQLHKCLRDDGILIVTVPNGLGPRELLVTRPVQFLQYKSRF